MRGAQRRSNPFSLCSVDGLLRFARNDVLPAKLPRPRCAPQRPQGRESRRRLRHKGIGIRARYPLQIAADQRQRQEHRPHLRRHVREQIECGRKMLARLAAPVGRSPRASPASACPKILPRSRCRVAAAVAAAGIAGAARHRAAARRSPAPCPGRGRRGVRDGRSPPTAAPRSARRATASADEVSVTYPSSAAIDGIGSL